MPQKKLDFHKALQDPRRVFGVPERTLADPRLDREGKRAILKSWEQDERELAGAAEEGTAGGKLSMLQRVLKALESIAGRVRDEVDPGSDNGAHPDPAARAQSGGPGGRPETPGVGDLMCRVDEVVHVDHDLHEASVRMRDSQAAILPVIDGDEIVGVLTARDIYGARRTGEECIETLKVRDHLSKEIAFCYEADDLETARSAMHDSGHHRLLVLDGERQLVGLITAERITSSSRERDPVRSAHRDPMSGARLAETTVRAKGSRPGAPGVYAVRPKIKT